MDVAIGSRPALGTQIFTFGRHFLEMCISMCVGGGILAIVAFAGIPSLIGHPNLRELFPQLSLLLIALFLTAPMAGWMLFRGMPWRPTLEMAAVPLGLAGVIIVAVFAGILAKETMEIEFSSFCGVACVGMFIVMLFRLDLYAGRGANHHHPVHAA